MAQCACLNQDQKHGVKNLFQAGDYLESDCDEQLLIFVPFQQTVKVHSLKFDATTEGMGIVCSIVSVTSPTMDYLPR